ncbi:uncharacterized protein N7515_001765 [Penicillium bovifimosum]|uniref:Uncharacterized protein n=1 Tax=Penicillium bovifimosum TaxID=126998 RepID=A0A9W9HAK3_9EURO|nr:uncharacterized protein N7515_001765 [Penicillium bovifimosum]KAJ5142978.1 hypothetical protein N7515_001765 [Penicillium bovifimosum]
MARDFTSKPFRDVVREQRGLLVHPLRWTPHHLELLGCRFEEAPTAPVFPETPNDQRRPPERPDHAEVLAMSLSPVTKCYSLENILLGEEPKSTKPRDYNFTPPKKELLFIFEVGEFTNQTIPCSIVTDTPSAICHSG